MYIDCFQSRMSSKNKSQNIATESPSIRSTLKRHLANSSILPRMIRKSKFSVSPNKFALLVNNDTCENNNISTPSINSIDDLTKSPHTI